MTALALSALRARLLRHEPRAKHSEHAKSVHHRRRASLGWREKMLLGLAVAPASRLIDSAAVGNNGRKTIDTILGAWNRVSQNGQRPVLAENISYESYRKDGSKYIDEVKIDVGGKFQKLADLTDEGDRY